MGSGDDVGRKQSAVGFGPATIGQFGDANGPRQIPFDFGQSASQLGSWPFGQDAMILLVHGHAAHSVAGYGRGIVACCVDLYRGCHCQC